MKKSVAVILFLTGLVAFTQAADIPVKVGGPAGENIFDPQMVMAAPGDNIVFNWVSGKHSVLESDAAKSCVKSVKADAFTSGGAFPAPKTWTLAAPKTAGKTWFFCGVPGHCEGGMYGTLIIGDAAGNNTGMPAGGMPAGGMPAGGMPGASPTDAAGAAPSGAAKSSAARNYNSFAAGVVLSSMCMAAAYVL